MVSDPAGDTRFLGLRQEDACQYEHLLSHLKMGIPSDKKGTLWLLGPWVCVQGKGTMSGRETDVFPLNKSRDSLWVFSGSLWPGQEGWITVMTSSLWGGVSDNSYILL